MSDKPGTTQYRIAVRKAVIDSPLPAGDNVGNETSIPLGGRLQLLAIDPALKPGSRAFRAKVLELIAAAGE